MADEETNKGFTIRDRRSAGHSKTGDDSVKQTDVAGDASRSDKPQGGTARKKASDSASLPEIDFTSFVFSLSTSALCHLGEVPDPITQKTEKNLPLAKQTIDILGMLQEKTKGNLSPDEARVLESILADLRWRYVRDVKE